VKHRLEASYLLTTLTLRFSAFDTNFHLRDDDEIAVIECKSPYAFRTLQSIRLSEA